MRAALRRSFLLQLLTLALVVAAAAALIGLVTLWPDSRPTPPSGVVGAGIDSATVSAVVATECRVPDRTGCALVSAELRSGPEAGSTANFRIGETSADVRLTVGDRIRVYRLGGVADDSALGQPLARYGFSDFERGRSLLVLALVFAALVVAAGRWRGLRALIGLALSLLVVVYFIVPAILDGSPGVEVALVGAFVIMFITVPLAHGLGPKSFAALLGTAISLCLTAILVSVAASATKLTGLGTEEASYVKALAGPDVSTRGLLLAGMIIGALGVLDDLTVTQSSTVMALRRANEQLGARALFREALDVGHDHIAATVNTLVLAYAGASLPILLLFSLGGVGFGDAVNGEAVAAEVVAMLVGSIGLIAAVPVTTAVAALVAVKVPLDGLRTGDHGHAHH